MSFPSRIPQSKFPASSIVKPLDQYSGRFSFVASKDTPFESCFKRLFGLKRLDRSQFDPIDRWVCKILEQTQWMDETQRTKCTTYLDPETLVELIGLANSVALLSCGVMLALENANAGGRREHEVFGISSKFFKCQLDKLLSLKPKEIEAQKLSLQMPIFDKSAVNEKFNRQLTDDERRQVMDGKIRTMTMSNLRPSSRAAYRPENHKAAVSPKQTPRYSYVENVHSRALVTVDASPSSPTLWLVGNGPADAPVNAHVTMPQTYKTGLEQFSSGGKFKVVEMNDHISTPLRISHASRWKVVVDPEGYGAGTDHAIQFFVPLAGSLTSLPQTTVGSPHNKHGWLVESPLYRSPLGDSDVPFSEPDLEFMHEAAGMARSSSATNASLPKLVAKRKYESKTAIMLKEVFDDDAAVEDDLNALPESQAEAGFKGKTISERFDAIMKECDIISEERNGILYIQLPRQQAQKNLLNRELIRLISSCGFSLPAYVENDADKTGAGQSELLVAKEGYKTTTIKIAFIGDVANRALADGDAPYSSAGSALPMPIPTTAQKSSSIFQRFLSGVAATWKVLCDDSPDSRTGWYRPGRHDLLDPFYTPDGRWDMPSQVLDPSTPNSLN